MVNKKKYFDLDFEKNSNSEVIKNIPNLEELRTGLDTHSSCLCLAKFTQVTMHLGSGLVHSCHHPKTHKIPIEEVKKNPAALFNTSHLKNDRKKMLRGERPSECDYCWRVEDDGNTSDRIYKSLESWALPSYDKVTESSGDEFFKPTYLEVSFGNACNMKCSYCGPEFSSRWQEELVQQGPLKVPNGDGTDEYVQGWQDLDNITIPNREYNPYIEAFWLWFPEIYPNLKHFRITGGEPILNKNTIKALDYVKDNPRSDLEISINSNLSVSDKVWEKFLQKIKQIENEANFKKITVFASIESWGEKAEYSRDGLEFDKFVKRFEQLLQETSVRCTIMATYNLFAITSFRSVLEWILELKKKYNYNKKLINIYKNTGYDFRKSKASETEYSFRVGIDIPYLRHPAFLDVQYCSDSLVEDYMYPCLEFMENNISHDAFTMHLGFEPYEVEKFQRIFEHRIYFKNKHKEGDKKELINKNRAKFYDFVEQLDKRRDTDFAKVFPEMESYLDECFKSKIQNQG